MNIEFKYFLKNLYFFVLIINFFSLYLFDNFETYNNYKRFNMGR